MAPTKQPQRRTETRIELGTTLRRPVARTLLWAVLLRLMRKVDGGVICNKTLQGLSTQPLRRRPYA